MRILHTSDWHLGVSLETAPRHEEHGLFLTWLLQVCIERQVDVLVHAGDIFHFAQPSAQAQAQLYDFLARANQQEFPHAVVLTAGNHDSPSRILAPKPVLGTLQVHVVGDYDPEEPDFFEVEREGELVGVVAALPYLSESRLGLSTTEVSPPELARRYADAFHQVYQSLLEEGRRRYPGLPLVCTGHLTAKLEAFQEGDFTTPLHQFMTVSGVDPGVFEGWDYAALGHIHRYTQVGQQAVYYSGSPVATNFPEAQYPHYVLLAEVVPEKALVEAIKVPVFREIFELRATADRVMELLAGLRWDTPLTPYLAIELVHETPGHSKVDEWQAYLKEQFDDPPRLVRFRQIQPTVEEDDEEVEEALLRTDPKALFEKIYEIRYGKVPDSDTMIRFGSLMVEEEQ